MTRAAPLSASEFAARWMGNANSERAAAQEHFIDLCRMLGVTTPNEADPKGEWYAFEKGAEKVDGSDGFADVWKRGHFAWEYKGKHKNLEAAYTQLLQYREALENPPLLVVCDLDRFEVHTNFTATKKTIHRFSLMDLRNQPAEPLRILRALMTEPLALRPEQTAAQITEEAAGRFAQIAQDLRDRGHASLKIANFLNRILFCLFAEDVGLLPKGLLTRLIENTISEPKSFASQLAALFKEMKSGGHFGPERIEWFNGGLFDDDEVLLLAAPDIAVLREVSRLDWGSIEPAILGTLFERGLDPGKRSQLGAHYTDRADILKIVEPVIIAPLRRELESLRSEIGKLDLRGPDRKRAIPKAEKLLRSFLARLRSVKVLDPACGSGNFLYVALQRLKDLEKEVIIWGAETIGTTQELPGVGPQVVCGIELNPYAAELARVTIWIGQIQWMLANGWSHPSDPILQPLETIECRDAIFNLRDPDKPMPAHWPDAEFIIGNPPFLGGKRLRDGLGNVYVDALFEAWKNRVPREADLVCYWHEKAREQIANGHSRRAGLIATQNIRSGANQKVLKAIKESGDIFLAWSDQPWIVEGADVRISIVGQDDGSEKQRALDGKPVEVIYANLAGGHRGAVDVTQAQRLSENLGVAFMGDTKGGPFDIDRETARRLLEAGPNPNGRPNSDVVLPWMNAFDLVRRSRNMLIVDFGTDMSEREAARYEAPFEYVREHVRPDRIQNRRAAYASRWWLHVEPRPALRKALRHLSRFIATPTTAKHRSFAWLGRPVLPDHQLIVIAREDDYALGVLHSRAHELWSLRKIRRQMTGSVVYAPSFAFETFPFPWPLNVPNHSLAAPQREYHDRISAAALELNQARSRWLSPPELVREEPDLAPTFPTRLVAIDEAAEKELRKRTLTSLYNARPAWLDHLHRSLDAAVLAAYGWPDGIADEDLLAGLLALNKERARTQSLV